jgi:hypothetical protein
MDRTSVAAVVDPPGKHTSVFMTSKAGFTLSPIVLALCTSLTSDIPTV